MATGVRGQVTSKMKTFFWGIVFNLENVLVIGGLVVLFNGIDTYPELLASAVIVVANLFAMCSLFESK